MPQSIPIALLNDLGQEATTLSYKLRVGPTPVGTYFGMTSLDRDEIYDAADGIGPITYYSASGIDLSTLQASNNLTVDNGEAQSLVAMIPGMGITVDMVDKGELDTTPFIIFQTNYSDPANGHRIHGAGVLGRCRVQHGLLVIPELRSWTQLLDQNALISKTSILCRANRFGSQPGEEREFCGFDLSYAWDAFIVTAVGAETVREFTIAEYESSGLVATDDFYAPGMLEFETGDNEGFTREVEAYASSGVMSLRFVMPKPVQVGDTGRIRFDCTRAWTGHNSCETHFGIDRGAHHRGEPNIPIGNTPANSTPGVNAPTQIGTGEAV